MWNYPESIIFFACGNSGGDGSNTVGSPATNKNGVAVGASLNDRRFFDSIGVGSKSNGNYISKDSLAAFSSRGPTQDGRLKPDICSVGKGRTYLPLSSLPMMFCLNLCLACLGMTVSSAESQYPPTTFEHCSIRADQGTSFSAPLLAGYAAIVRQYFREGYYPSGEPSSSDGFVPSGALLKAMIIHSGQPLSDITDLKSRESTTWGDANQGYGRAQLDASLSFTKSTLTGLSLFVLGAADPTHDKYVEMKMTAEQHTYHFTTQDIDNLSEIRVRQHLLSPRLY